MLNGQKLEKSLDMDRQNGALKSEKRIIFSRCKLLRVVRDHKILASPTECVRLSEARNFYCSNHHKALQSLKKIIPRLGQLASGYLL